MLSLNLTSGTTTVLGTISGNHDINGLIWRDDGKLVGLDNGLNGANRGLILIDVPGTARVGLDQLEGFPNPPPHPEYWTTYNSDACYNQRHIYCIEQPA